jgi:hypothetical protein
MRRRFLLLLFVALLLAGCEIMGIGGDGGGEAPETPDLTPVPTLIRETEAPATETLPPAPTPTVEVEEPGLDFTAVSDLSALGSYRLRERALRISTMGGRDLIEHVTEVSRSPQGRRLAFTFANDAAGHVEIVRVTGTSYVSFGQEWRSTPLPPETIIGERDWTPDPAEFLGEGVGTFLNEESLEGLQTKRYHYDRETMGTGGRAESVLEGSADVWVSTDYGVYLKLLLRWKGLKETGEIVTYEMETTLHDVNEPIAISIPVVVDRPGIPYDVPLMEGGQAVSVRGNVITFDVGASPQDVMAFYAQRMPVRGWRLVEGRMPLLLRFAKRGRAISLLVKSEAELTTVILVQEGGAPQSA